MASSTNIASREVNLATGPLVPSRRSQLNETISFLDHKRTCAEQNGTMTFNCTFAGVIYESISPILPTVAGDCL
jgi:hypothetical protein